MDFDSYFRNKIESVLITASWVEEVPTMLGIKGVSQVWGDQPEWYFWIDGAPGAYSLVFESGVQIEYGGQDLVQGQFALKCFPGFKSDAFETLSPQEQELRLSRRFDATGTPRMGDRADIPEAYFTVGSISLMLNAPETAIGISFDSLDRIRWKVADDIDGPPAINANDRNQRVVRRLSGWRIGYPFFDCLIGLYAYYTKYPPVFWAATQSPGFECILDPVEGMQCRRCDDSRHWSGSVLFCAPADTAEAVDYLWRSHLDSTEKIVFEQPFDDSEGQAPTSPGDLQMPVNPLWRELAHSDLKSCLSSTCGCCDHTNK